MINDIMVNKITQYVFKVKDYREGQYIVLNRLGDGELAKIHYKEMKNFYHFERRHPLSQKIKTMSKSHPKKLLVYDNKSIRLVDNPETGFNVDAFEEQLKKLFDKKQLSFEEQQVILRKKQEKDDGDYSYIYPSDKHNFSNIILHSETLEQLDAVLSKIDFKDFLVEQWGLDKEDVNKNIVNLYGPPGTGKTLSAKIIAHKLKKKILIVNFAQLISKYVGETGKNISEYFKKAKEESCILLFDEADTLVQSRSRNSEQAPHMVQSQNIFMQELDRFEGIVLLTSNFFENYDPAMLRRMYNVKYNLPDTKMRFKLLKQLLGDKIPYDCSLDRISDETVGFSGGELKQVVEQMLMQKIALVRSQIDDKAKALKTLAQVKFKEEDFMQQVILIKNNKKEFQNTTRQKISLVS